jgi:glycosyltransferase involved in cell wall biosynthesis
LTATSTALEGNRQLLTTTGKPGHLLSVNAFHYRRGGADNVYFEHARLAQEWGWETSFFSMHHAENLPSPDAVHFAEEIDYTRSGSLGKRLVQAGRVIYSFEAQRKLAGLLDTRSIDIAHVHNIYHHQSPSILVELKKRGIPTVLTAHDLKLACPAYTMLNATGICERCKGGRTWNVLRHQCIKGSFAASALIMVESSIHKAFNIYGRHLDKIVTPSRFYRDKLIEWGLSADQIVHIPNFISDKPNLIPKIGGDHILYFGRLSAEKGLATLIRAAAHSGVPVKLVGRGPQEAELRALVEELNAPVSFMGFQSGENLWALVDDARAIVLPSEWYENGPLSALEALQRGKGLIGANIGGIPEIVIEGETGWLFQSGNVDDLARALRLVLGLDNAHLAAIAQNCQKMVMEQFSEERYSRAMLDLYGDLLQQDLSAGELVNRTRS